MIELENPKGKKTATNRWDDVGYCFVTPIHPPSSALSVSPPPPPRKKQQHSNSLADVGYWFVTPIHPPSSALSLSLSLCLSPFLPLPLSSPMPSGSHFFHALSLPPLAHPLLFRLCPESPVPLKNILHPHQETRAQWQSSTCSVTVLVQETCRMYRHSEVISKIAVGQQKRQLQRGAAQQHHSFTSAFPHLNSEGVLRVALPGPSF